MLQVDRLVKLYPVRRGLTQRHWVHAADQVDLVISQGETLGLVGESGSGKSTVGRCILRLEEPTGGTISLSGDSVTDASGEQLRHLRSRMQMVYQDPLDSLNPRMRIGDQVAEPIWLTELASKRDAKRRVGQLLELVGLHPEMAYRYPHQLSGGQQQRVAIARAIACEPKLVILDEPTASLDVSVQAQIIRLLADLQQRLGMAYLLISHDLPLVSLLAHRVAVMYMGQIVEVGPVQAIFERPFHPYTRALLSATPKDSPDQVKRHIPLKGELTSPIDPPETCRLVPRCPFAQPICLSRPASLEPIFPDHATRCVRFQEEHSGGVWEPTTRV